MSDIAMKSVGRADIDILLAHLVRCRQVIMMACAKLQLTDFDEVNERGHQIIWEASSTFFKEHNRPIPLEYLNASIELKVKSHPAFYDPNLQQAVYNLAYELFLIPEKDLVPGYALNIMQSFLFQRRVLGPMVDLVEKNDLDQQQFDVITKARSDSIIGQGLVVSPFDPSNNMLGATPRHPTGLVFVDKMLNGGPRPKEAYGFIAPSGGGKTTIGNQLAASYAGRAHRVLVCSYEEEVSNDYCIPLFACAARIKRDRLEHIKTIDDFTDEEKKRFRRAQDELSPYLRYVDLSGSKNSKSGRGGPPEIQAHISELASAGFAPEMVIIDWFLPMYMRYSATVPVAQGKKREERHFAGTVIDEIKRVAETSNCIIWLNHQIAAAEGMKKRIVNWNDAAEFKQFAWYLNGCFGLSALNPDGVGKLCLSKSRGTGTSHTVVRLEGEYATFVSAEGDMTYDSRSNDWVPKGKQNAVPRDDVSPHKTASKTADEYQSRSVQ